MLCNGINLVPAGLEHTQQAALFKINPAETERGRLRTEPSTRSCPETELTVFQFHFLHQEEINELNPYLYTIHMFPKSLHKHDRSIYICCRACRQEWWHVKQISVGLSESVVTFAVTLMVLMEKQTSKRENFPPHPDLFWTLNTSTQPTFYSETGTHKIQIPICVRNWTSDLFVIHKLKEHQHNELIRYFKFLLQSHIIVTYAAKKHCLSLMTKIKVMSASPDSNLSHLRAILAAALRIITLVFHGSCWEQVSRRPVERQVPPFKLYSKIKKLPKLQSLVKLSLEWVVTICVNI